MKKKNQERKDPSQVSKKAKKIESNAPIVLQKDGFNNSLQKDETSSKIQATKKSRNPYFLFQNEVKEEFQKKYPELKWTQIISKIGQAYRNLAPEQKKTYESKASQEKEGEGLQKSYKKEKRANTEDARPISSLKKIKLNR